MQMLRLVCRCGVLRERTRSVTFSGFVGSAGLLPRAQGDRLALIFSSTMLKSFCARNKFRPRATGMEEKQQSAPWKRSAGWRHTRVSHAVRRDACDDRPAAFQELHALEVFGVPPAGTHSEVIRAIWCEWVRIASQSEVIRAILFDDSQ